MKISYILSMIKKRFDCHVLRIHDIDIEPLSHTINIYTGRITQINEISDIQYGVCHNCGKCFRVTSRVIEQAFSIGIKHTTQQITVREFQDATTLLKL